MKEKVKGIILTVLMFVLSFALIAFYEHSVISKINEFVIEVPGFVYGIAFSVSFVVLVVVFCVAFHGFEKEHLFLSFLKDHWLTIVTISTLLLLFINSIHKEVLLERDFASGLIGVEWTMFGVSFCVFSVWRGVIFDNVYLKNEVEDLEEKEKNTLDEERKLDLLHEKQQLHRKYIYSFFPAVIISINAFVLVSATGIFFLRKDYDIYSETLLFFAAFCCTNTLVSVLQIVFSALKEKRNELLARTQVSPSEINAYKDNLRLKSVIHFFEEMDKDTPLKDYCSGEVEIDEHLHKCATLLEGYKKDPKSALTNKNKWFLFYDALGDKIKKSKKKRAKLMKKIEKIEKELKSIYEEYPSFEKEAPKKKK